MSRPSNLTWKPRSWRQWLYAVRFQAIALTMVALIFVGLLYFQAAAVSGLELNARTWEIRQFYYYREPFTHYQMTGVTHAPGTNAFWTAVSGQLLAVPDSSVANHLDGSRMDDRWDLVRIQPGNRAPSEGKANILVNILSAHDHQYKEYWGVWSTEHSVKASYLWPAAQDLVRFELYAKLPRLFELTEMKIDDQTFQALVNQLVQATFVEHCDYLLEIGEPDVAQSVAKVGLEYGVNPELLRY